MSMTIFCVGQSETPAEGRYSAAEFEAAAEAEIHSACLPYDGRKMDPAGRRVLIGEERLAQDTAEKLLLPCTLTPEPLLNEIPQRAFADTEKLYPLAVWRKKAAGQRKHADPHQPESKEAVIARCEQLIRKTEGSDAILVTYPLFLEELLDRLRIHGYVIQRTGLMKIQPMERFVVSRREEHCGGCQHNCFLSNPGCGVGKDKANRIRQKKPETTA